jgi:hypothetical protein
MHGREPLCRDFAGKDASILSSVFRNRGTQAFYQIRVGTDTIESANDLCAGIRRVGGACMYCATARNVTKGSGSRSVRSNGSGAE